MKTEKNFCEWKNKEGKKINKSVKIIEITHSEQKREKKSSNQAFRTSRTRTKSLTFRSLELQRE